MATSYSVQMTIKRETLLITLKDKVAAIDKFIANGGIGYGPALNQYKDTIECIEYLIGEAYS